MKYLVLLSTLLCGPAFAQCFASGTTDQYTYFVAVDSTDFTTRETGLSSFTVYRSRDGGTSTAMTTPTVNETDTTNQPGVYELLLDEDMTIGAGNDVEHMVFHITATGMSPVTKEICIADYVTEANIVDEWETQSQADPTGFHVNLLEVGGTAQTANDNGADINAILVDTTEIGAAGAGLTAVSQQVREDSGALRCEINVGNNTNSTTSLPCIMTDPAGNAWSGANDALNNKRVNLITVATPAPYQGDFAFITDTVWDGVNSELVLTISPALSGALEDTDVVEIVP